MAFEPPAVRPTYIRDYRVPAVATEADIPAFLDWLRVQPEYKGGRVVGVLLQTRDTGALYRVTSQPALGVPGTLADYGLDRTPSGASLQAAVDILLDSAEGFEAATALVEPVLAEMADATTLAVAAADLDVWRDGGHDTLPNIPGDYIIRSGGAEDGQVWRVIEGGGLQHLEGAEAVNTPRLTRAIQDATAPLSGRISTLEAAQTGGLIGYATLADLTADLAHPDRSVATVTNDPTPANNGEYRKTGASGTGSWVPASTSRTAVLEARATALEAASAASTAITTAVAERFPLLENVWESAAADGILLNGADGTAFAAWGFYLGARAAFDRIEFSLLPRTPITQIRLAFRSGSKTGAVLFDQTYAVATTVGVKSTLTFDMPTTVGNGSTAIYLEWHANGKTGFYFATSTLYPSPPNPNTAYSYTTDLALGLPGDLGGGQASYTQRVRLSRRNYAGGYVAPTTSWLALMDTRLSNPSTLLPRFGRLEPVMGTVLGSDTLPLDTAYDVFTTPANNNYGFGFPIGVRQGFDLIEFMIVAFQSVKVPTFVKVRLRSTDSAGAILGEVSVPVSPRVGSRTTVRALFPAVIPNAAGLPLWLEFTADGFLGFVGQYGTAGQPYTAPLARYVNVALTSPDAANGVSYPTSVFPSQATLWARFGVASGSRKQFAPTGELAAALQALFDTAAYWRPVINLPPAIYAVEGVPCELYWHNIVRGPGRFSEYEFDVAIPGIVFTAANVWQDDRHWSWTPTTAEAAAGDRTMTLTVRRDGVALVTQTVTIRVSPLNRGTSSPRKLLAIADSLTEHGTYLAQMVRRTQDAADPLDVTSVGTRVCPATWTTAIGLPAVSSEGWSGKTVAYHYSDPASNFTFDGSGNATGTTFDFARYLSVNGISLTANDLVYFALGTNDIGAPANDQIARLVINQMIVQLDAMIATIRAAVPGVNIGVVQIIPAANTSPQRQRNRARAIYLEMVNAKFGNREAEKIYVMPMGHVLDPTHGFPSTGRVLSPHSSVTDTYITDTIHPTPPAHGYYQMGDALYGFLKWLWRA